MEKEISGFEKPSAGSRRWLIWPALIVVAFLAGFLPMWWSKQSLSLDYDKTKRELVRQQLLGTISAAVIYARRGDYETARQKASKFFTDLQSEIDSLESNVLTAQERKDLPPLMAGRDEVITLLSRGDPASAERLSDIYTGIGAATAVGQP